MAKVKNVEIVDKELTPTVLAVKQDKKKSSILSILWLVIIFAIFIGGVYYLPEISKYVNSYFNPEPIDTMGNEFEPLEDEEEEDLKEEIKEYKLSENPKIVSDKITIKSIKVEDKLIVLDIENTSDESIDLKNLHYFLNLLDNNKKLLGRIKLSDGIIAAKKTGTVSYNLSKKDIVYVSLVTILENEYPAYTASANEDGKATLICTKDFEKVTYMLSNNKVFVIQDVFEVPKNNSSYEELKKVYNTQAATYSNISGVNSDITEGDETLTFKTTFNLNSIQENAVNSKTYFEKDIEAKVIKFEMELNYYTCK